MKVWKKNMIAAAILVTVCAGIYANWLYADQAQQVDLTDLLDTEKVMSDEMLALEADTLEVSTDTAAEYFASVRLSRQQARDSAVELLQEVMASNTEGSKTEESAAELEDIVQTALSEAQIESLVIAKGYADCVAYMGSEGVSVAVAVPEGGLQQEDVALIADIVMTQSEYTLSDIRIVEVQ